MDWRALAAAVLLLAPAFTLSSGPFTSINPEQDDPDAEAASEFNPYAGLVSRVQAQLRTLGFYAGPVNGEFGSNTQAALAQFQLLSGVPVSGQLDDPTLAELGVEREGAAAGASSEPAPGS